MTTPLEPDADHLAALNEAVVGHVTRFLGGRTESPAVSPPTDPALIAELLEPPDEHGRPIGDLLEVFDRALDTGFDTASGKFLSYVPSGGLYAGALGAFLGAVTNPFTGASHAGEGPVAIEQSVIDWMAGLFGLPDGSGGVLLSGGSIANLTAMVTARTRLGEDFGAGVVYTSEWSHHSIEKAARIAGISRRRVRKIPTDRQTRMDTEALSAAIAEDRSEGLVPMMITATAGVTDTGAVDPLARCAAIAADAGAWFHVDAAYGGFFQLTDRGRARLNGIERADSITVDAHKSLFLPFGTGGLLVRDPAALVDAHEGRGTYMQDVVDAQTPHYTMMGPELTRPYRGLSVWLALHLHGVAQFRHTLDRMLDFAARAAAAIDELPPLELVSEPELSIVVFRSTRGDDDTRRIFEGLNASGDMHVSSTTVHGRFAIRLAFLSQRTTEPIVDRALDVLAGVA